MVNVWNERGDVIGRFDTLDEAEEYIEEGEHEEMTRTHNGADINIGVIESW